MWVCCENEKTDSIGRSRGRSGSQGTEEDMATQAEAPVNATLLVGPRIVAAATVAAAVRALAQLGTLRPIVLSRMPAPQRRRRGCRGKGEERWRQKRFQFGPLYSRWSPGDKRLPAVSPCTPLATLCHVCVRGASLERPPRCTLRVRWPVTSDGTGACDAGSRHHWAGARWTASTPSMNRVGAA